jgi:Tfp pilus assembly protein PilN
MIRINLLPNELRPIKHSPMPYAISGAILFVAVLGMLYVFGLTQSKISDARQKLDAKKTELQALQPEVEKYNSLSERKIVLDKKSKIIQEILSDRVIWSEHLSQLAKLTPDNIWYKRIRVVWQSFKEQQPKFDPKTNKPVLDPKTQEQQYETKSVQKPVLEISGFVIADAQGERKVYTLTDATTKEGSDFAKTFVLQPPKLEDMEFKGFSVRGFTLNYVIVKGGKKPDA